MNIPETEEVVLSNDESRACIRNPGAELVRWQVKQQDWLHRGDAHWWSRSAPLLFPVVGRSHEEKVRIGTAIHDMPIHGFAAGERFTLDDSGKDWACFKLVDNARTRLQFPFRFELSARYQLGQDNLSLSVSVLNCGDAPMPVAFGTHPAFVWPLPGAEKTGHSVWFSPSPDPEIPEITHEGLFAATMRTLELHNGVLELGDGSIFAGNALCFLEQGNRTVRYGPPGGPWLSVSSHGFRHIALWSIPGAPFLSIEHWTGRGEDAVASTDLFDRPGAVVLSPQEQMNVSAKYVIESEWRELPE